jgi:hypothetical protein
VVEPWQAVGGTFWTSEDNRPYTKPQWQGLTDEELMEILGYGTIERSPTRDFDFVDVIDVKLTRSLINAIEAKLKAKNT